MLEPSQSVQAFVHQAYWGDYSLLPGGSKTRKQLPDRYQNASRFDFSTSLRQGIFMKFEAIYKMLPLAAVVQKAWDQGSRGQDCQVSVGILEFLRILQWLWLSCSTLDVQFFVLEQKVACQELFIVHGGLAANSADALPQAIFD